MIVKTKEKPKKDQIFDMYIEVVEDYNVRLLSTKVYWDKPEKREEYKEFWNKYKEIIKTENNKKRELEKQILFLKNELKESNDKLFVKEIKQKLVELGAELAVALIFSFGLRKMSKQMNQTSCFDQ